MTYTKESLTQALVEKMAIDNSKARSLLELVIEEIKWSLEKGEDVKITGFGKWKVLNKKARIGRNPHTGTLIDVSARKVVTFTPSDTLRSYMSSGKKSSQRKDK